MTTYYVGKGGNDGNSGTSWANRKLTLTGAEDIPVAAGDTVYVGPGAYRETLTLDVSGTSGNHVAYIADVTGANTDGIGGIVRVTGSDDDDTYSRNNVLSINGRNYRTFRGFALDGSRYSPVYAAGNDIAELVFEDCFFQGSHDMGNAIIEADGLTGFGLYRCVFICGGSYALNASPGTAYAGANNDIQDCLFIGSERFSRTIRVNQNDGFDIRNCTFIHSYEAIKVVSLTGNSYTLTVENCIIYGAHYGFVADATGEIVEDYNLILNTGTPRTNTTAGSNSSTTGLALFAPWLLYNGLRLPQPAPFAPSEWSSWAAKAGSSQTSTDLFGTPRPSTNSKVSWGAIQFSDVERDTGTTYDGSDAALKLSDAGIQQITVPVEGVEITISVRAYREANYAGTAPRMVIRQPGQSARTTTDAGSASTWNLLSDTFTPASSPPYVVVELQSNNTATSGSYAAYFDDLTVT